MSQAPPFPPPIAPTGMPMQPHRGGLILALGIIGIVLCFVCGIFAWVMGNTDLREMDAGRMDPGGRSLTQAGKICGIIGTILGLIGVAWALIWMIFFVALAAGAAASGGGAP
jgi:hypothetical protein